MTGGYQTGVGIAGFERGFFIALHDLHLMTFLGEKIGAGHPNHTTAKHDDLHDALPPILQPLVYIDTGEPSLQRSEPRL